MDWKNNQPEEAIIAQIQIAPISAVAEIIEKYRNSLEDTRSYIFGPYGASDEIEAAVFQRNDPYLNLLLATTVTDKTLARRLWEEAEKQTNASAEYRNSLKKLLLQGCSLHAIIKENEWREDDLEGKISLADLLCNEELNREYARLILTNPYSRGILKKILLREGAFSKIPEANFLQCIHYISDNKALNIDTADSEGPDFTHLEIEKAIEKLLRDAPVNAHWFYALMDLVSSLEPKAFSLYEFPVREFADKWLAFKAKGRFSKSETDETEESEGSFTTLTETQEFVSLFCAKFGKSLLRGNKLKVSAALKLQDIPEKSAYFGTSYLGTKDIEEALDAPDPNVLYWLIFNDYALRNPETRQLIRASIGSGAREWVFKTRIDYLKQLNPEDFSGEVSKTENKNEELFSQLSDVVNQLNHQVNFIAGRVKKAEDTLKTIGYGIVIILVAIIVKSCI